MTNNISLEDLSCSIAYSTFTNLEKTDNKCVSKYVEWNCPPPNWLSVWSSLDLWSFVRSVLDTNWLLFHASNERQTNQIQNEEHRPSMLLRYPRNSLTFICTLSFLR